MAHMKYSEIKKLQEESKKTVEFFNALVDQWHNNGDEELGTLAWECKRLHERLQERAITVKRTMESLLNTIDTHLTYSGVSSLGELQSAGPALDVCCALYSAAFDRLSVAIEYRKTTAKREKLEAVTGNFSKNQLKVFTTIRAQRIQTMRQLVLATTLPEPVLFGVVKELNELGLIEEGGTEKRRYYSYSLDRDRYAEL